MIDYTQPSPYLLCPYCGTDQHADENITDPEQNCTCTSCGRAFFAYHWLWSIDLGDDMARLAAWNFWPAELGRKMPDNIVEPDY